ncbi:MAG: hypothetical protein WC393_01230 [Candidatus Nanoarchaeia archaeon]|jgi:predicted transcriptional regulator
MEEVKYPYRSKEYFNDFIELIHKPLSALELKKIRNRDIDNINKELRILTKKGLIKKNDGKPITYEINYNGFISKCIKLNIIKKWDKLIPIAEIFLKKIIEKKESDKVFYLKYKTRDGLPYEEGLKYLFDAFPKYLWLFTKIGNKEIKKEANYFFDLFFKDINIDLIMFDSFVKKNDY